MIRLIVALTLSAATTLADGVPPNECAARRAHLASQIGGNAMLVVLSAPPSRRNGDVEWPFRQSDNLLYLTRIAEPDTTLVLLPGEQELNEVLFVRDRNPQQELWTGKIPTHEEVTGASGVAKVESNDRFRAFVSAAIEGAPFPTGPMVGQPYQPPGMAAFSRAVREGKGEVWLAFEGRLRSDLASSPEMRLADDLQKRYPEIRIRDASFLLRSMRVIKSPAELTLLQRAIDISDAGQKAGMKRALTAASENEVQATIEYTFRNMGACCWGYPSIVASGPNATTLHYQRNDAPIKRDGLILTDVGAEVDGYTADVTRTYPANGRFSDDQRAVYSAVFTAQDESLALMRPGMLWKQMNDKAVEALGRELLKLGLISKSDPRQVRWYLPYPVSHHIGLDVHDVTEPGAPFAAGMVVTNEPGIYVRRDDVLANSVYKSLPPNEQASIDAALKRYNGIGVRIEDDILVTESAPRILSAGSPRTILAIEQWMASKP